MTTEEVIAIAKTLRDNAHFIHLSSEMYASESYSSQMYLLHYLDADMKDVIYGGDSWEDVLKEAGWKGDNSKPKTRKSTRSETGWEG